MSKNSGSSGAQTVTQQPPQYVQTQAEQNMGTANYLASQPFPNYQGQLIAPENQIQAGGQNMATQAATSWAPYLNQGATTETTALGNNPVNPSATNASNPFNPGLALNGSTIGQYMSPFIQASLQPQIQAAQQTLAGEQLQNNAGATQANAFGDARQGVQGALDNYYGNQNLAGIEAQGLNTGYNTALSTAQGEQNLGLQEQGVQQQQQNLGLNEQNTQLQGGQNLVGLGGQAENYGITGANAVYNAGQQIQNQQQQQLDTAYQQYLNQVQWPYQQLNVQESAISNNPYSLTNNVQLPGTNPLAGGLGSFANLAGSLGSLTGNSSSPFG